MDTSQGWLAFSLSNPNPYFLPPLSSSNAHHVEVSPADEGLGPKLEDFFGGGGGPLRNTGGGAAPGGIYVDSDLKAVAAGFLRGPPAAVQEADADAGKTVAPPAAEERKAADTFGQRTSIYRGVTRHRWTGRYEAHLWDNSCRREGQSRKGRQVYLGGYDKEEKAARAYDLAALKYWGPTTTTNFPVSNYETELEEMKNMTRQEFVASLRRKSSGFSRGASIYRGVTRHHQHGRWQARIGRVAGNKDLYLGTFSTQEEAAEAYDIAAIKFRGLNAVTNFDMSRYDVKSIASSSLPIGGMSSRMSKASDNSSCSSSDHHLETHDASSFGFSVVPGVKPAEQQDYWSLLALHHQQQQQQQQGNQALGFGLFTSGINMDFSNAGTVVEQSGLAWSSGNGVLLQHQHEQQQSQSGGGCSSIPYATPIGGGFGGNQEGQSYNTNNTNVGSWVASAPSLESNYYHQAASTKPNVAFFHTPIFGME